MAGGNRSVSAWTIELQGLVQGIGFRPFTKRLALDLGLTGWVQNTRAGVSITAVGPEEVLREFASRLQSEPPPGAFIIFCQIQEIGLDFPIACSGKGEREPFQILASEPGERPQIALVSPDLSLCEDCRREMMDPGDRRFGYPFITCTRCGPRFSVMWSLPYDREKTTMAVFAMCPACSNECAETGDRRFHAQSVACGDCGPRLRYRLPDGGYLEGDEALNRVRKDLETGRVVAVKGIGGFHLVCDARCGAAVRRVRAIKNRPHKPLAVMFADRTALEEECLCPPQAGQLLTSPSGPIVVLPRKRDSTISPQVSPQVDTVGAMLPYSPLHLLLFSDRLKALVVTSANLSGEPVLYEDDLVVAEMGLLVDGIVLHDRLIANPLDDSVYSLPHTPVAEPDIQVLIRRGRGLAPLPVSLPQPVAAPVLACGSDMKGVFCLARGALAFPSPYTGDLAQVAVLRRYRYLLQRYRELFRIEPEVVACDLHPEYVSSTVVAKKEWQHLPCIEVQHHHAHVAACMGENEVAGPVLGVAYDGTGFGPDGTIWGGEFLYCTAGEYRRVGHWRQMELPGGEQAILEPWRTGLSLLKNCGVMEPGEIAGHRFPDQAARLLQIWDQARSVWPLTSSMGRLFDGVAAILGLVSKASYDGQGPLYLENAAWQWLAEKGSTCLEPYDLPLSFPEGVIDYKPLIRCILKDVERRVPPGEIAARFHRTVAEATISLATSLCQKLSVETVAVSGGVWQNVLLGLWTRRGLQAAGMRVLTHSHLSPNDECISYGQTVVAGARMGK